MKNTTRGWYLWEDGTCSWYNGLSPRERKIEELKHGKLIRFEATN